MSEHAEPGTAVVLARMDERLKAVQETMERFDKLLGESVIKAEADRRLSFEMNSTLVRRLERLEDIVAAHKWWMRALGVAAMAEVFRWINEAIMRVRP